jgi:peptide/nickel transport system permease protein
MAVAGYALPSFWIGLIFILVFAVHLHVLPAGGASSIGTDSWDIVDKLRHLVGPVLILSLAGVSNFMRYVRTEMLDVLAEDYVRTARAKGLSEHHVISRHVLRASLLPLITAFGGMLAQLVSGALVVEQVFAWPGVGRLAFDAAQTHDAPVVLAVVVVVSIALLAGYSIRDLAYAIADPRIRNT